MTKARSYFTAGSVLQRGKLAWFGTLGSLLVWAGTLLTLPLVALTALLIGPLCVAFDTIVHGRGGRVRSERTSGEGGSLSEGLRRLAGEARTLGSLEVRRSGRQLALLLAQDEIFAPGLATLSRHGEQVLRAVAERLRAAVRRIDVVGYAQSAEGHTGDVAAARLSAKRVAVAAALLRRAGCLASIRALTAMREDDGAPSFDGKTKAMEIIIRLVGSRAEHAA